MASLQDAQQLVEDVKSRLDVLQQEVTNGNMDFSAVVRLADEVGAAADRVAVVFQKINDALEQQGEGEEGEDGGQSLTEALSPTRAREAAESLSREELLQRAKKADIPGRSEMSKEQLVQALARAGEKVA